MNLEEICFIELDFMGTEITCVNLHKAIILPNVLEEVHDKEFP